MTLYPISTLLMRPPTSSAFYAVHDYLRERGGDLVSHNSMPANGAWYVQIVFDLPPTVSLAETTDAIRTLLLLDTGA